MALSNRQAPLITFYQWVEKRVQEHDFDAYSMFNPDGSPWTLERDIESYVVEYLTRYRSQAEAQEFNNRLVEIEGAPDHTSTTGQMRSNRRRRMLYGHSPEMLHEMVSMVEANNDPDRGGNRLLKYRSEPEMMRNIPEADMNALVATMEDIQKCCWVACTLNDFSIERQREFDSLLEQEREIFFRMEHIFAENGRHFRQPWNRPGTVEDAEADGS
ncbi:hypothetical protein BKA61DRAFT_710744 [Leptodontidium sp. MPI-SDFR-AT-0119]|nr:hypothetical protein BKA61DRAFT_710744 [Leptodontidium sp. MPI-SDFR-AT-0119]